jgi:diaminopimelate epimerase
MVEDERSIRLWKFSGIGNDFLIRSQSEGETTLGPNIARGLLHRRFGWGSDGLIELTKASSRWSMTLWNSDGTEAEMSGNGLRCLGHAITRFYPETELDPSGAFEILTQAGSRRYRTLSGLVASAVTISSETSMSSGSVVGDVEVAGVAGTQVAMGNPHFVVIMKRSAREEFEELDLSGLGSAISRAVDGGTNVEWVLPVDDRTLRMKVWERGVGPTLACGTGSCASFLVARSLGLVDGEVTVVNPGGELTVRDDGETLWLGGTTDFLGEVTVTMSQMSTMEERA